MAARIRFDGGRSKPKLLIEVGERFTAGGSEHQTVYLTGFDLNEKTGKWTVQKVRFDALGPYAALLREAMDSVGAVQTETTA